MINQSDGAPLLSTDQFGIGHDKTEFRVFDFCQNLEYFSQSMVPSTGTRMTPLSERIFRTRLDLLERLDALDTLDDERGEITGNLRERLASMNDDNFLVRPISNSSNVSATLLHGSTPTMRRWLRCGSTSRACPTSSIRSTKTPSASTCSC